MGTHLRDVFSALDANLTTLEQRLDGLQRDLVELLQITQRETSDLMPVAWGVAHIRRMRWMLTRQELRPFLDQYLASRCWVHRVRLTQKRNEALLGLAKMEMELTME